MKKYLSDFLNTFDERGFLHQCSDSEGLDKELKKTVVAYIGFDCTAKSLHVGSLIQIMTLRHLQKHGHTPVVLIGGGTSQVGDPSGKEEGRKMLSEKEINKNAQNIKKVFSKFLNFRGKNKAIFINNSEWLNKLNYIKFLRDFGKHFTINKMLTMDSVKLRLDREQHLSFLEFNYMVLQAYDFLKLNKKYNCKLQIGGSDQWGNIVGGADLTRRISGKTVYGLTTPLLTTASGDKMGKTSSGAIWLDEKMLSSYEYWQFWRNTNDADVVRFLKLFTELPLGEIKKIENVEGQELNEAKMILATECTKLLHGTKKAEEAKDAALQVFEKGVVTKNLPSKNLSRNIIKKTINAPDLLVETNMCQSKSEVRKLIRGGGVKCNDKTITDELHSFSEKDLIDNSYLKLSVGKKRHLIIKII